jgi:hypothetical protein
MTGNFTWRARFMRSLTPTVTIVFTVGLDQLVTAALLQYVVPTVADLSLADLGLPGLELLHFPLPLPVL